MGINRRCCLFLFLVELIRCGRDDFQLCRRPLQVATVTRTVGCSSEIGEADGAHFLMLE